MTFHYLHLLIDVESLSNFEVNALLYGAFLI